MGPVSAEEQIDVPREEIFSYLGDFANRPSFMDHFASGFHFFRVESMGVGAGARFSLDVRRGPMWMDSEITELDPPHRITERGRGGRIGRIPVTTVWEVEEGPGSLSTVRAIFWTDAEHAVDRFKEATGMTGSVERGFRTALRRLRDLLESGEGERPPARVAGGNRHATGVP